MIVYGSRSLKQPEYEPLDCISKKQLDALISWLESLNAVDIKAYIVRRSTEDLMKIVFTVNNIAEAIKCYRTIKW